jgi:predicted PurR-regulated permease PerM
MLSHIMVRVSKPETMNSRSEPKPRNVLLPQWARWGLIFPLVVLNGWLLVTVSAYFHPLFSVFAAAILLSFVLDYPVALLRKLKIERPYAVGLVFLLVVMVVVTLGATLAPVLFQQLTELANRLPSWIESGNRQLIGFREWAKYQPFPDSVTELLTNASNQLTTQLSGELSSRLQALTGQVLGIALSTVDSLLNIIITIVLSVYLLLYGEDLWDGLFRWFPERAGSRVRRSLYKNFHNYFVGQVVVAGVAGVALTLAFLVMKVPLGLLFGITIGLMTLVPFGGILSISVVSFLVGLQNFGLGLEVLGVSLLINQINDNFVVPRVLGGLTGLNPVWVFVSLLCGVKLGGVLGLLLAVPLSSFVKTMASDFRELDDDEDSATPDGVPHDPAPIRGPSPVRT